MTSEPRANFLAGEWRPARFVARVAGHPGAAPQAWPQSSHEDVALAWEAAHAASAAWRALGERRRGELVCAMARALEGDQVVLAELSARFGPAPAELAAHVSDLERGLEELAERPVAEAGGVAWCAPDWRDLVRAPLLDVARELHAGRVVVLVSDARFPALAERLARAAFAAELPPGTVGLLHGARRELLALGLAGSQGREPATLVASGLAENMTDLRRIENLGGGEARLRALRCGAYEVDPARAPEESAAEVVELAFGRGTTLGGQLPGSLARVFCPQRLFSRFSELCLERLEHSDASRLPVPQIDEDAAARVRAAWELGLDEGATCIAGGDGDDSSRALPPTVFTNVEPFMASAKRQDPLPVLCLMRAD